MSCCGDCIYMDLNDERHGEYYCGETKVYCTASKGCCCYFKYREDGGGCYLTTIVCNILGYADNGEILSTLRAFRDNVMSNDSSYNNILSEYDNLGPKLANCIEADQFRLQIAQQMKEEYIVPVCQMLVQKNYNKAVERYKEMVLNLKRHYLKQLSVM